MFNATHYWNDPDEGLCSKPVRIVPELGEPEPDAVWVAGEYGDVCPVYISELTLLQ